MKIQKLHIHGLRNDAHFQFHTEFRDLIVKHGAQTLKVQKQFEELYLPLYEQLDDVFKKIRKSALTEKITEADVVRDDMCIGIYEICRAYLRHFEPSVRDAAKRLKIVFDTYGNITKKPLNEQTSAIYNLSQELEGKYVADVKAIGASEWVARLKAANENFDSLMKERYGETASKNNTAVKDARKDIDDVYKAVRNIINVFDMIDGPDNYEPFIKTLNAVIAKYAMAIGRKSGGKAAISEEADNEENRAVSNAT